MLVTDWHQPASLRHLGLALPCCPTTHYRPRDHNGAHLAGANLNEATLIDTDLTDADLTGCRIFGISAWRLKLDRAKQQNLIITLPNEPEITVEPDVRASHPALWIDLSEWQQQLP